MEIKGATTINRIANSASQAARRLGVVCRKLLLTTAPPNRGRIVNDLHHDGYNKDKKRASHLASPSVRMSRKRILS
ncbi:hypothetical protein LNP02_11400 [Klebsiella variicola subsp. variicola]|nr:hypothetical protein [Klebsiella variicola subsp. variicola]